MIVPHAYQGKTVGVFGLARTGRAAVSALAAAGAEVLAWDDDPARRDGLPVEPVNLHEADFARMDALMLSPGVPLTHPQPHPLADKAKDHGVVILGDSELFAAARTELAAHAVIGITGTNGKSTTAALMAHVLATAGRPAALGGNIGVPILGLEPLPPGGVYVFELSSFQIDLTLGLDCEVAVLLNITPDHLDRHGSLAGYVAAKRRLFEMQSPGGIAVIGVDDDPGRQIAAALPQRVVPLSVRRALDGGLFVTAEGRLMDSRGGPARLVADLSGLPALKGRHNWQNAAAVFAAGEAVGLTAPEILAGLESFSGLAHRCEPVGDRGGIVFINDSKATNTEAAATALAAFDRIRWIAGGRPKSADLSELAPYFRRIRRAYLIGEAEDVFARELEGHVAYARCGTVERAVAAAVADAKPGETVVFSPACASFDQFADFEARGEAFRSAVRDVIAGRAP